MLLDTFGPAEGAYSLRLLRSGYTGPCVRVRETANGTEANIGFTVTGDLDLLALAAHCGTAAGTVVIWYDQSGRGRDARQIALSDQPVIWTGAGAVTSSTGKPAILFEQLTGQWRGFDFQTVSIRSCHFVFRHLTGSTPLGAADFETAILGEGGQGAPFHGDTGTALISAILAKPQVANSDAYMNGVQTGIGTLARPNTLSTLGFELAGSVDVSNMGRGHSPNRGTNAEISEVILFSSLMGTNRIGITNDSQTYWIAPTAPGFPGPVLRSNHATVASLSRQPWQSDLTNLELFKGEPLRFRAHLTHPDGATVDLTSRYVSLVFGSDTRTDTVFELDAPPEVTVIDVAGGIVEFALAASEFSAMSENAVWPFSIWVVDAGIRVHHIQGLLRMRGAVQIP